MVSNRGIRVAICLLGALAAGLLAAGCGSSGGSTSSGGGETSATGEGGGGTSKAVKATGTPIPIGLANQEGTPAGSFGNFREAAEAAVEYANNELGGVDGRPIELRTCITKATPESSAACANKLIQQNVDAVIGGPDYAPYASYPIYSKAKIPVVGGTAFQDSEMALPGVFKFNGWSAALYPAMAEYATKTLHAKSVAIVYARSLSAEQTAKVFTQPVLEKDGAKVDIVVGNAAAADWNPQFSSASGAEAIIAIATPQTCVPMMQAYSTLGLQSSLFVNGNCFSEQILQAAGAASEGVLTATQFNAFEPGNEEMGVYEEKIGQYAPSGYESTEIGFEGFAAVMNIRELLSEIGGAKITPQSIIAKLGSTREQPNFLAHPYSCDGKAATGRPSLCNTNAKILTVKGGKVEEADSEWLSAANLLAPPQR